MTTEIIDFVKAKADREGYLTGDARCLSCKHEWVAVVPEGTVWMECPECGLEHGRFIGHIERGGQHWTCQCGNNLFYVTEYGCYCPSCGEILVFDQ